MADEVVVEINIDEPELDLEALGMIFAYPVEFSKTEHFDPDVEIMMGRFRQQILGRTLERIEIKYPINLFEHFRKVCFPQWLLNRWPVKHYHKKIEIKEMYPSIELSGGHKSCVIQKTSDGYEHYIK